MECQRKAQLVLLLDLFNLSKYSTHVALHILATFELITLSFAGSSLVYNAKMVGITCAIDNSSPLQNIVGNCYERRTATTGFNLMHIFVSSGIGIGLRQV